MYILNTLTHSRGKIHGVRETEVQYKTVGGHNMSNEHEHFVIMNQLKNGMSTMAP